MEVAACGKAMDGDEVVAHDERMHRCSRAACGGAPARNPQHEGRVTEQCGGAMCGKAVAAVPRIWGLLQEKRLEGRASWMGTVQP